MTTISWGIIGAGGIAKTFVEGLRSSDTGKLAAVASRAQAKADEFVAAYAPASGVTAYGSYEALLADPAVDAVYISTPHPQHCDCAIRAARAGKHVLCEKPIALNHAEASAIVDAARQAGVFLMEAFMYRCHPQTAKLVELIRSGAVGDVRLIQASFGFHAPFDPDSRLYKHELGGGGILDVGCYPVSMARLIAGAALGRDFADPLDVQGMGHLGPTGVDEYAAALLRFDRDILATVATGVRLDEDNTVRVFGDGGDLFVPNPWVPAREGGETQIVVRRTGETERVVVVQSDRHLYAYEIDAAAEGIERLRQSQAPAAAPGQASPPCMTWGDTLGNMKTLDAWRRAIGLTYPSER
jgi:predicted dehydrogenase